MSSPEFSTKTGTVTGIVLTLLVTISGQQLMETAIFAGVGALASYTVSYLLKYLMRRRW